MQLLKDEHIIEKEYAYLYFNLMKYIHITKYLNVKGICNAQMHQTYMNIPIYIKII